MFVVPAPTLVTSPVPAFTVAAAGVLLVKVPPVTVSVKAVVAPPAHKDTVPVIGAGFALMVTTAVAGAHPVLSV